MLRIHSSKHGAETSVSEAGYHEMPSVLHRAIYTIYKSLSLFGNVCYRIGLV